MRATYKNCTERTALNTFVRDCNVKGVNAKNISLVVLSKNPKTGMGSFELYTTKDNKRK